MNFWFQVCWSLLPAVAKKACLLQELPVWNCLAFEWVLWGLLGWRGVPCQVKLLVSGLCLLLSQKPAVLGISVCRCRAARWHCLPRFVLPNLYAAGSQATKPPYYTGFASPSQLLLTLCHTFLFTMLKSRALFKNKIYHQLSSSSSYTKIILKGIRKIWSRTWYLQKLVWELS